MNLNFKIAAAAIVFNTLIAAAFAPTLFVAIAVIVMIGSVAALHTLSGEQLIDPINVGEVKPVAEAVEEIAKPAKTKQSATPAEKPKKPRKRNYNRKPKTWAVDKE